MKIARTEPATQVECRADLKHAIARFWDARLCGSAAARAEPGSAGFFAEVEAHRYSEESHIPAAAELDAHPGERILELGAGLGTDGRRLARAARLYVDLDLSRRSLELARQGFRLEALAGCFVHGDAEGLPFCDASFDLVYTHGVLHHTPDIGAAVGELHRVLRPGGKAIVMLYARRSAAFAAAQMLGRLRLERTRRRLGRGPFNLLVGLPPEHRGWLPAEVVLRNSTDGLGNPWTRVYTAREIRGLFDGFVHVELERHYVPWRWFRLFGTGAARGLATRAGRWVGFFWYVKAVR